MADVEKPEKTGEITESAKDMGEKSGEQEKKEKEVDQTETAGLAKETAEGNEEKMDTTD
jgi:hypothetical protein